MKKWACYGSTVKVFNPDSYFKLKNRFLIFLFVLFHVHHCTYVSKKIFPVTLLLDSLFYKFHFPNNGKNKHAHSVYNSTELHMSWTPGAINLLSSKKASKILGLFLGGGGLGRDTTCAGHSVISQTKAQRHSVWQKTAAGTPAVNCLCYQPDFPLLHPEWQYSL